MYSRRGTRRRPASSLPGNRYVSDLLAEGSIGELRSVRMHVSIESFGARRMDDLAYTVPAENFSDLLPIFRGHFLRILFSHLGFPRMLGALTANQIAEITIVGTWETLSHTYPDQINLNGTLTNGAVLSVHVDAGKRNNFGLQIELTGTEGDLSITNGTSFGASVNRIPATASSPYRNCWHWRCPASSFILTEVLPAGLLPQLAASLHNTEAVMQQLISIYALGSLLSAIPLAAATQQVGLRTLLLTAVPGFAFSNMVTALSSSLSLIFVARFVGDVAAGLARAIMVSYAACMVPASQKGRAIDIAMAGRHWR
ncbi:MFS transporter [Pseudoduganella lurida]|uniref:MFS transporter n=1 Tax=Pseudoduganella lurida TaxID=1036180 RepID=A0A562RLK5_9BURK|nr:MFS transporter [Pseudoduganella lurida]TWI69484.1 MFS transporter [Pseudoduganella lurida]